MEKKIHQADQHSRWECLEIAFILDEINDRCLEKFILKGIFRKLDLHFIARDVSACHWLRNSSKVIIKFVNWKETDTVMANKFQLWGIRDIYVPQDDTDGGDDDNGENKDLYRSKAAKFINESLCSYYRYLNDLVRDRKNEGIIGDFKIVNGSILHSTYINILHESDLWRPFFNGVFDNILQSYYFLFFIIYNTYFDIRIL